MDCSTPGSSVLHHLLKVAQIHIHWVGGAFQVDLVSLQVSMSVILLLLCFLIFPLHLSTVSKCIFIIYHYSLPMRMYSVWNLFSEVFTAVSQAPRRMIGMTLLNRLINKTWEILSFIRGILSFFVSCHWFLFCPLVFFVLFCLLFVGFVLGGRFS